MSDQTPSVPPCAKCGARRRRVAFMPHPERPGMRLDLYRCESCGERTEVIVPAT
jgi:hypothetical protein